MLVRHISSQMEFPCNSLSKAKSHKVDRNCIDPEARIILDEHTLWINLTLQWSNSRAAASNKSKHPKWHDMPITWSSYRKM